MTVNKNEVSNQKKKNTFLSNENTKLNKELITLQNEIKASKKQINDFEIEVSNQQKKITILSNENIKLNEELNNIQSENLSLIKNNDLLQAELVKAQNSNYTLNLRLKKIEKKILKMKDLLNNP